MGHRRGVPRTPLRRFPSAIGSFACLHLTVDESAKTLAGRLLTVRRRGLAVSSGHGATLDGLLALLRPALSVLGRTIHALNASGSACGALPPLGRLSPDRREIKRFNGEVAPVQCEVASVRGLVALIASGEPHLGRSLPLARGAQAQVPAELVRCRVAPGCQQAIAGRLVAVGRRLVTVRRRLVTVGTRLIRGRQRLVTIRKGLFEVG